MGDVDCCKGDLLYDYDQTVSTAARAILTSSLYRNGNSPLSKVALNYDYVLTSSFVGTLQCCARMNRFWSTQS